LTVIRVFVLHLYTMFEVHVFLFGRHDRPDDLDLSSFDLEPVRFITVSTHGIGYRHLSWMHHPSTHSRNDKMTGPWMWTHKLVCLHPQYITSYKLQVTSYMGWATV